VALLTRRLNGEADAPLAAEHGVSVAAISHQARRRGMRKTDHPGACG
jgi:hypothetical protein